jgi:hypothetical protein
MKKTTLNDIRKRKAEVLREMRQVRADVRSDCYALCHPFKSARGGKVGAPALSKALSAAGFALRTYKTVSSVVSFFRRRRKR